MQEKDSNKVVVVYIFAALLMILILIRLIDLQLVKGKDYALKSESHLVSSLNVPAPRGEILDRYGRPLVINRMGFSIQFRKTSATDEQLNSTILAIVNLMDEYNQNYVDTLPLNEDGSDFLYMQYEGEERQSRIDKFRDKSKLKSTTAGGVLYELCERYGINPAYTLSEKRKIAGVRYEMETRVFSASSPYTFAADVDESVVMILREQSMKYDGVNIVINPVREYVNGSLASHILGRVGIIYQEEYELLKDKNYGMNDIIGKDGMEKYLEPYIRGTDGKSSVEQTFKGKTTSVTNEVAPIPGDDALLTIDIDIQRAAEDALARTIADLQAGDTSGNQAKVGSCVAVDVNTGEILAIASYPSFNPTTFDEDYNDLYNDPLKPMFNRALGGAYAPGSTFKMLTAIAGLEEGVITTDEYIKDEGVYEYYGQTFDCWIYTSTGENHGYVNVSEAIRDSCNYYFYETGRRLGVDKMMEYGKSIGLGEYTGIEIEGETKGVLASPEYKQRIFEQQWFPGDTLQMAIGQSFNLFSPLQLASYTATLANGGTRYRLHLLKNVRDRETGEYVVSGEPVVLGQIDMKDSTRDAIFSGMRKVCQEGGTAASVFAEYPIPVCAKTGSAQVNTGAANGVFVAFAPADNPRIAVAVVVENAGSGNSIAPIAREIFDVYFQLNKTPQKDNTGTKNQLLP
ncbi:MAG: penicillin-binding protein 2 [Clostridia bacterium]|nr:penicillin-binding protein 2 [Clostridia bacterium]